VGLAWEAGLAAGFLDVNVDLRRVVREKGELRDRLARYKQRHPETVGVEFGKPSFLGRGPVESSPVLEHRHPGAKGVTVTGHPNEVPGGLVRPPRPPVLRVPKL
jgi:hypothetical protein